ncbi:zinc finger CCCH-type with G patch domain-containing protein-like [Belonocnema kinseyi]|uniref:zinc finger CCCH-type with G patch domain-containing protein-like n=1 Tax=Belonocnema kinseyi TaxID=2817044 RepID=UPI00143D4A2A|nr:zinc finger CCCH-type with G patch domain-containing protein-like [Belonocnema kinseyi]
MSQCWLSQVEIALSATPKGPDKDNLLSLQSDILEVIQLTKESLESMSEVGNSNKKSASNESNDDPLAREYALFKAELENSGESTNGEMNEKAAESANDIEDELEALEGMKCRAPHGGSWGGIGYHNAMVWSVHKEEKEIITSLNDIKANGSWPGADWTNVMTKCLAGSSTAPIDPGRATVGQPRHIKAMLHGWTLACPA